MELRRGDHAAARLKLEQEREERRMKAVPEKPPSSPETRARRIREVFGLPGGADAPAPPDGPSG